MATQHLETIWNVCTRESHSIRIVHPDITVEDGEPLDSKDHLVGTVTLYPDGELVHRCPDGRAVRIDEDDVVIEVYTRPFDMRGPAFIPDMTTSEGRAQITAMMTDPRYHATSDELMVVDISLAHLAAMPGAAGVLDSIAYDTR